MWHTILNISLLPLLLLQGIIVKIRTPKLAEAAGVRQGEAGDKTQPRITVLFLGDSAAAGVGVTHQSLALSGQTLTHLSDHLQINWLLLARSGANTQQILNTLATSPCKKYDFVIVSLGVNDVISFISQNQWQSLTQRLISVLKESLGVKHIIFTAIPPLHQFPALPQPLRFMLGQRAKQFNRRLKELCGTDPSVSLLEISFSAAPAFFAADGFHPGKKGYAKWGEQVAKIIEAKTAVGKV